MTPFEKTKLILRRCLVELRKRNAEEVRRHPGIKFEGYLAEIIRSVIQSDNLFSGIEVEEISGQRFPDIVLKFPEMTNMVGVEVKTTNDDKWQTLGGSIFESTRVENVSEIILFFAKLGGYIDYLFKPYEECIKNVLITHKPRYSIDMKIEEGETIFSEIGMSYEEVRKLLIHSNHFVNI